MIWVLYFILLVVTCLVYFIHANEVAQASLAKLCVVRLRVWCLLGRRSRMVVATWVLALFLILYNLIVGWPLVGIVSVSKTFLIDDSFSGT